MEAFSSPKFATDQFPRDRNFERRDPCVHKKMHQFTCEVYNDTQVRYRGNVMSLSKAAGLAKGIARELWGPKFWQYEGELLFF